MNKTFLNEPIDIAMQYERQKMFQESGFKRHQGYHKVKLGEKRWEEFKKLMFNAGQIENESDEVPQGKQFYGWEYYLDNNVEDYEVIS